MRQLLADYYGMQRGVDRTSDMESTTFDSKEYVRGLLRTEKMDTLLSKDDEMVRGLQRQRHTLHPPDHHRRAIAATIGAQRLVPCHSTVLGAIPRHTPPSA